MSYLQEKKEYSDYELIMCQKKKNGNIKCKPWNLHIRSFNVSLTRKSKDNRNWILFYQSLFIIASKILDFLILGAYIVLEMKDLHREFHINPQWIGVTSVFRAYLLFRKVVFNARIRNYFCNRGRRKNMIKNFVLP